METKSSNPIELTPSNCGVPIRLFVTPDLLPDAATTAQLQQLANAPGLDHYVAVLPDVHRKGRNVSPTGTVVVSRNAIVPRVVDIGINCGMRMLRSDIAVRNVSNAALDELFGTLRQTVPGHEHARDVISAADARDIFVRGGAWSRDKYGLSEAELDCIEDGGTTPTDTDDAEAILASMPDKVIRKGKRRFCTLGPGNHFLELQEIVEILDREAAALLGLSQGNAVFMVHTCGRGVASKLMAIYLPALEQRFRPSDGSNGGSPFWAIPADSDEGTRFARAIAAVANFGYANRVAITEEIRSAIRSALNDDSLSLPLLYDCSHVSIKRELWNGNQLWVHRHGASRALPASRLAAHPVFSKTGQPVPIPGSMGNDSFIAVASEGAAAAFHSVNHGAGRVLDKPDAAAHFNEGQVLMEMQRKNIRLYRYGIDNIVEQAPGSFKDVLQVGRAVSALGLAKPVVRLRPVAVLKG
jgi:tRNA-splicing ligase RtcB